MILYLFATAAVIMLSYHVLSVRERALLCVPARGHGLVSHRAHLSRAAAAGIFVLLFGIQALRLNVGNDYAKYVEFMHLARCNEYVPTEVGFNILAWTAYRIFGYENFLFCFGVMAFITVAGFMLAIDRLAEDFFLSFSMFMLLGYYFQSINTVRYYLALAMAACSMVFLLKKDYPKFLLIVIFAACFHKSALIVLFFYPAAVIKYRRSYMAALLSVGALGLIFRTQVLRVMLALYPTYQETSLAEGGEGSVLSILRCAAVLALTLTLDRESVLGAAAGESVKEDEARARRFYCHCNILALTLYLFFFYLPVISRIGYYLTFTQIFYVPMLIRKIKPGTKRRLVTALAVVFCAAFFVHTMRHASDDGFRILPYQTFVFHEMPPILSETGY